MNPCFLGGCYGSEKAYFAKAFVVTGEFKFRQNRIRELESNPVGSGKVVPELLLIRIVPSGSSGGSKGKPESGTNVLTFPRKASRLGSG